MNATRSAPDGFHLLAKPTGSACNLDCQYCFFLSKEMLYAGDRFRMSDEVLEAYIVQLLASHRTPEVTVAWQGGEPALMGLDFYKRSVQLVNKHRRPEQQIEYTFQTNGTLLDDEWCAFFKANKVLVGLSVDGPRELHDTYRVNKGGKGSFDEVMRGWELLRKHGVDFNILCTINAANANRGLDVYRFFRDELGANFVQFIPIVERATPELLPLANQGWSERPGGQRPLYLQEGNLVTDRTVKPDQYGQFLVDVFEEWVRRDVGEVYVQMFDVTLGAYFGQYSLCIHAPTCGGALALEHNGDLYSCDHFVEPKHLLGNIRETDMIELVASPKQQQFGQHKLTSLPQYCLDCDVRFACNGGCPKDRFAMTPDGQPGLNYLCPSFKKFFGHVRAPMQVMADLLKANRAPSEIIGWYANMDAKLTEAFARAGRNDPCPCGSGKKFKQCHLGNTRVGATPRASRAP